MELVIDRLGEINRFILLKENKLENLIIEDSRKKSIVGNIYCGNVQKIVNKKFAFINIGLEKNAFLDLSDTKESLLVNNSENKIKFNIKQGDSVLVQVLKDATNEKGPAVSSQINIKGENLVVFNGKNNQVGISKKIFEKNDRDRLRDMGNEISKNELSIIFRTSSIELSFDELEKEFLLLKSKFEKLMEQGKFIKPPALVVEENYGIFGTINELLNNEVTKIISNDKNTLNEVENNLKSCAITDISTELIEPSDYIKFLSTAENQIEKLFNKNIWLKSGGFIVIEETEACNVIDVNTSKSINIKNQKEVALKTNLEAVLEIANQVKLRNLSGIIIVDFIDMSGTKQKNELLKFAKKIFEKDKIKTNVVSITELGLMQITRQKKREPISRILRRNCSTCNGLGSILKNEVIVNKIFKEVFGLLVYTIFNDITICANENIIREIKENNFEIFQELEKEYKATINYKILETNRFDFYEIEKIKR